MARLFLGGGAGRHKNGGRVAVVVRILPCASWAVVAVTVVLVVRCVPFRPGRLGVVLVVGCISSINRHSNNHNCTTSLPASLPTLPLSAHATNDNGRLRNEHIYRQLLRFTTMKEIKTIIEYMFCRPSCQSACTKQPLNIGSHIRNSGIKNPERISSCVRKSSETSRHSPISIMN